MNSAVQTAFDSWTPPIFTIATLLAIAALYARGFARVHRQMPTRFARRHLASFLAGIATLLVAIASPLEALDDLLLHAPMTHHPIPMSVPPALRRIDQHPSCGRHVFRSIALSLLCEHAAHRGLHSPWRPHRCRRDHVGASLDFLSCARSRHHVPDTRPAKSFIPLS